MLVFRQLSSLHNHFHDIMFWIGGWNFPLYRFTFLNKLTLELTILCVITDFGLVFFYMYKQIKVHQNFNNRISNDDLTYFFFLVFFFRNRLLATSSLNFKPDVINMLIIIPLKDGIAFLLCNNWDNVTRNPRE